VEGRRSSCSLSSPLSLTLRQVRPCVIDMSLCVLSCAGTYSVLSCVRLCGMQEGCSTSVCHVEVLEYWRRVRVPGF